MPIHFLDIDDNTAAILAEAKPANVNQLDFEVDILAHWAVRWESATPHKRQKYIDSLQITLGVDNAIPD